MSFQDIKTSSDIKALLKIIFSQGGQVHFQVGIFTEIDKCINPRPAHFIGIPGDSWVLDGGNNGHRIMNRQ